MPRVSPPPSGLSDPARRSISLLLAGTALLTYAAGADAQEVRRAQPVDVPTARAVPIDPFETPAPKPKPPVRDTRASITDETGPREVPLPGESHVSASSADEVQLDFANGFYARGLWDSAAPEYEKYLGLYPHAAPQDREAALYHLGECYRKLNSRNAAKNAYQTLLANYGTGQFIGPAAYRLADLYFAEKDFDSALDFYRKASVRLTDPALVLSARFYSARCLEAMKLPSEARITYEDIVATKGDNPFREPSRLSLAEILDSSGRKEEALKQYTLLAQEATQPEVKAEALVKAGMLNIDLGHPGPGSVALDKALKIPEIAQNDREVAEIGLLRVLYAGGKYKQLLDEYDAALKGLPDSLKPEVLILGANAKRELNDYAGASEAYARIIKDYPKSAYVDEAKYQRLVSLYNSNDSEVIAAVDQFIADNPDSPKADQVKLLKAEALFKAQKYQEAAPVYTALRDSTLSTSLRAEALFKAGWCYTQLQQPEKAIPALTDFLDSYPLNKLAPNALAQRALAYQQTKDLAAALKDYDRLIEQYPKTKERELALQQKGLIQGEQQDNAGMAETFKQLLKEYPQTSAAAQANYWIGWAAYLAKDYKASIGPLEAARKLDKAQFFERATVRIIASYYNLEQRDALAREVDLYDSSKPKDKVQVEVLRWLGTSYLSAKDYANAEKYLVQVTQRDEVTPDDWMQLGNAQLGAAQYQDAVDSFHKYLALEKETLPTANGLLALGRAQIGLGKLDEAQTSADKVCTMQPEGLVNAQGRLLSGDIKVARGNFDAASKIYLGISVIIDDPQISPVALEKAYNCLTKIGNSADAAKVLNTLQTRYPEYQLSAQKPGP